MKLLFSSAAKIDLAQGEKRTWEQLLRLGTFTDPRYGKFEVTPQLFEGMIKNFSLGTYGQKVFVNIAHEDDEGAAGEITALRVDGDWLMAQIDWFPLGIEANREKGFIYLSAEYFDNFQDNEKGDFHGPLLAGCALTIRPVIKQQRGIKLSEDLRLLIDPLLLRQASMKRDEVKTKLQQELALLALSEAVSSQLVTAFEIAGKDLDEEALKSLADQFLASGKTLSETKPFEQKIELQVNAGGGVSRDDILKILQERDDARQAEVKRLADRSATLCKIFVDSIDAEKGLPEDIRTLLAEEGVKTLNPEMSEDSVKRLATLQLKLGQNIAAARQLSTLGYPRPAGSVHISLDESNNVKQLQETVDKRLGLLNLAASVRFAATGGSLPEANKMYAEKVLAQFDQDRGPRLHQEYKQLAGSSGGLVADVSVPVIWERTVIREFLYSLIGLSFVNADSLPFALSYSIPYSYRDTSAAGVSSTTVYQGGAIPYAGVVQTAENAYPMPQKLAFMLADELRYLTDANQLGNWDILAENTTNASRIISEDTDGRIFNTILQDADSFGAVQVASETLTSQVNGTNKIFVLANFPVCRPKKIYDLNGQQIGNTAQPLTVTYNSVVRSEWYSGISAGTYYKLDYNVGELQIVNETGATLTPTNATPLVVSYYYATNVYQFNTDLGALATPAKWDTFLYQYGLRKNLIEDQRFHTCNFGMMSGTVMSLVEQATQFGANSLRTGTDLAVNGNLGRVKDVPNYRTASPSLWMADQRIIIGERGVTRLRICKPWSVGNLENVTDSNGKFVGKKQAYGDQFIVLMTPTPLKNAYTSIVLYSSSGRVAR